MGSTFMECSKIKLQLVEEIAALLEMDIEVIDTSIPLHELGIDSLGLVELFVFIEKSFGIKLMESGITQEDLKTIDALSAKISQEAK